MKRIALLLEIQKSEAHDEKSEIVLLCVQYLCSHRIGCQVLKYNIDPSTFYKRNKQLKQNLD